MYIAYIGLISRFTKRKNLLGTGLTIFENDWCKTHYTPITIVMWKLTLKHD